MKQSKLDSLIEACVNTIAGFLFSFVIQLILNKAYGVQMSSSVAAHFVFWFSIASVARSYLIRRLWENKFWRRYLVRGNNSK